ncbi:MAG: hypothetical protein HY785_13990 [Oscillatoriophycideae cyanobacterium NC_groundwater_1537_Pr4_S-0.65um_50_18]|nr:hypothetical protein [Oscillatoriophycideae cyanobacterium NC_groundwater_1537_Pr4_S-0.65um_50_18]
MPLRFTTLHRYQVGGGLSPPSACACPAHVTTSGKAGGLKMEPLKAACTYHSSLSRICSMR